MTQFIVIAIALVVGVLLLRLFGAWMLRIDEVVSELVKLRQEQHEHHKLLREVIKGKEK